MVTPMPQPERFDILVLGSGKSGKLLAWHMARNRAGAPPWSSVSGSAAPDRHRELATPLQHDQAPRLNRIQATSTRGVRARIRRVAGCATPTGSAGHAGATANLKLRFHLDHSAGADQGA